MVLVIHKMLKVHNIFLSGLAPINDWAIVSRCRGTMLSTLVLGALILEQSGLMQVRVYFVPSRRSGTA